MNKPRFGKNKNASVVSQRWDLDIGLGRTHLQGELCMPSPNKGLILFAHGSGSGRLSPRNQLVADYFNQNELGTCLFDLLSAEEAAEDEITARFRFDIPWLSQRLVAVTDWVEEHGPDFIPEWCQIPLGYFGGSTGAAAAIVAATERPEVVRAVVSRGGRPDLVLHAIPRLQAATLLIVGEQDEAVLDLNMAAFRQMPPDIPKELQVIPKATHLFEEPGTLEKVAAQASQWFLENLHPSV